MPRDLRVAASRYSFEYIRKAPHLSVRGLASMLC